MTASNPTAPTLQHREKLRNVAIIAHVDHGKTTLVDGLLKQSKIFRENQQVGDLLMDSNTLERERGITILAKNTAIMFGNVKINIIDTPGHADFGGEVERVLNMADGCILLVDAAEGPMPQTRFVLQKAFEARLRPIVVINKIDRKDARVEEVLNLTQDLFLDLATIDEQLDFPVLYAIGRQGIAKRSLDDDSQDFKPLFEAILQTIPPPLVELDAPPQMLVTALDYDDFKGRYAIGRIHRGKMTVGMPIIRIDRNGNQSRGRITNIYQYQGLGKFEVQEAEAGDIIAFTGLNEVNIGETITDITTPEAMPTIEISEPTLKMTFGVNTSPFAGKEGKWCTSRQLRARLYRELETNVSLRISEGQSADEFVVSGRGELHLSILIETIRREGFEFQVSRPEVIAKIIDDVRCEPIERLVIDTFEQHIGAITEQLAKRLAKVTNISHDGRGGVRLEYEIPTRGLIGFRNQFMTLVQGNGAIASEFLGYEPWRGEVGIIRSGVLIASETGPATTYGLNNAQQRGETFIPPTTAVYEGMIIGLNTRQEDIVVNVCKEKKMTNVRSSTSDIAVKLSPPLLMSLEQSLDFINSDELVEVTPPAIRLRKRLLSQHDRARNRD